MEHALKKINDNFKSVVSTPKNMACWAANIPMKPEYLVYMVTDRCNSRCMHCKIWQQQPVNKPLTPDELNNILRDPLFENVKYILGTGGEPVVRKDIKEIMLAIHDALPDTKLQLSTNGLLPDRVLDVVNTLMKHNVNMEVGVSLDGVGDVHDRLRGVKGNFEKTDYLLRELVRLKKIHNGKLTIGAGIVVSEFTTDHINEARDYAKKIGIDLQEQWYNMASFYNDITHGCDTALKQKMVDIVSSQRPSTTQEKWLKWLNNESIKFPCFAVNNFCVLKCNGDMVPCLTKWDAKIGNAREHNPTEIWNSLQAKKVRKIVQKCPGCLNSWGLGWSLEKAGHVRLSYFLRHPGVSLKRLTN